MRKWWAVVSRFSDGERVRSRNRSLMMGMDKIKNKAKTEDKD